MLETYPRRLVEILELPLSMYNKNRSDLHIFVDHLVETLGVRINTGQIASWHHLDALLAFLSGLRYLEHESQEYGIPEEGTIVVQAVLSRTSGRLYFSYQHNAITYGEYHLFHKCILSDGFIKGQDAFGEMISSFRGFQHFSSPEHIIGQDESTAP